MKSNKNMLKISNTSKPNSKFRRNKNNNAMQIRCNLETKSSYKNSIFLMSTLEDKIFVIERVGKPKGHG